MLKRVSSSGDVVAAELMHFLFDDPTGEALAAWCRREGEPPYRARQVFHWVIQKRAANFDEMTDLPKSFREKLNALWRVYSSTIVQKQMDEDETKKLLLSLSDGQRTESVLLSEGARKTVCLSTQVGCGMRCVFCASGLAGLERNLSTCEMIEQLLHLQALLPADERLTHIVVMGMGEPLANLDALLPALDFATSKNGLGVSARHVTISTVGLPSKMIALAKSGRPYHLAVSLHAPNNALRQEIVPMAEKIDLRHVLDAADEYRRTTHRQVTFEYVMLRGVNDSPEQARELAALLGRRDAFLNLIPYNRVPGLPYLTPSSESTRTFARILREAGFVVKIRKRRGAAIDAACGQLRRSSSGLVQLEERPTLEAARRSHS